MQQTSADHSENSVGLLGYFSKLGYSKSWSPFLMALSTEFSQQLSELELRTLMRRVGVAMAEREALPPCDALPAVEQAINEVLEKMSWGVVSVQDLGHSLNIKHAACPLVNAMGQNSRPWVGGILEGLYQAWFKALGAQDALVVKQIGEYNDLRREFEFSLSV
ncbi:cellulose biosynthesis protein BcsD [Parvibium lacunae]|nr:cellulose biosynthesis protein BcsD [Parvibium lacunae]